MCCSTLLQCGVVDCRIGWGEQVQGKNSLLRRGVLVPGELVSVKVESIRDQLPPTVVASPIYRGPGPLPKY